MKIINKKIVLLFSVILLLSIAAFSTITLLFADEENSIEENSVKVAAATYQQGMSIIDYIIENSYNTEDSNDQTYHVVEIYSGNTPSALADMIPNISDIFEEHVFNGHKTSLQTKDYNPKKIDYKGYNLKTDNATLQAAIAKADLLYISEDPNSPWDVNTDISAEVRSYINNYALHDSKPIIFDSHNLTMQNIVNGDLKVQNVAEQYWAVEGTSYATFMWPHDMAMNVFMDPAEMSATYMPLDGEYQKANAWIPASREVPDPDNHTVTNATMIEDEYIGKILVIHNSAVATGDTHLTDKIKASFDGDYDFANVTIDTATYPIDTTLETLKLKEDSDLYKFGYQGRLVRPTAMQFEYLDMNDTDQFKQIAHVDYSKYDFVLVEPSTKDIEVGSTIGSSDDVFNGLLQAMYSGNQKEGTHVLFDSDLAPNPGSGGGSTSLLKAKNISDIYKQLATDTDTARYPYVLICTRQNMNKYAGATNAATVNDIARIINAGTFRGIGGSGSGDSSNVYTVLEIEPCYPINLTLAKALSDVKNYTYRTPVGNQTKTFMQATNTGDLYSKQYKDSYYYMRTDSVLSDTTDEIDYGGVVSLTTLLENPTQLANSITQGNVNNVKDYYNWRLSKAKIAHATGRAYDQVNVVHMSSSEFDCSRKTLLDNYDAIYIGGDNSAIKDIDKWYTTSLGQKAYNMYYHNGDMYPYNSNDNGHVGAYGILSGNDITKDKLDELLNYAKKGMPLILDKDLCDAFTKADSESSSYDANQTLLDPASNMFKLLKGVTQYSGAVLSNNTTTCTNTLVNFDSSLTYKATNASQEYGPTKEGFATVFLGNTAPTDAYNGATVAAATGVGETDFGNALNQKFRPLIAVTLKPVEYKEHSLDPTHSTWIDPSSISTEGLKWKVSCSTSATINLWIDDDSDGKFSEAKGELVAHVSATRANQAETLTFPIDSDYYGVVYWKIEAVSHDGLSASTTGCCKIKRVDQSKMYVNLLQIMPICYNEDKYRTGPSNETSLRTLFLCPDCQYAKSKLKNNRYSPTGIYNSALMGGENSFYNGSAPNLSNVSSDVINALKGFDSSFDYSTGTNLGTHTHDFGIVKYNPDLYLGQGNRATDIDHLGVDDIGSNWFDDIREDYDVDMTVMYTDEFDARIDEVKNLYASSTNVSNDMAHYAELADQYYNYLLAMRALINGTVDGYDDPAHPFHTGTAPNITADLTQIDNTFKPRAGQTFTQAMLNVGIDATTLQKYARASYDMDDDLTTHIGEFDPDKDKNEAGGYFSNIVDDCTNSDIHRDMRKYFDVFNATNDTGNNKIYKPYFDHYCDWRDANMFKNLFFDMYQKYLWYSSYDSSTNSVNLNNVYTCITIGAAETFGAQYGNESATTPGSDLQDDSCEALQNYMDEEGNLILFHDSLNSKKNATANMTRILSTGFGQNARHQDQSDFGDERYFISPTGFASDQLSLRMLSLKGVYIRYNKGQFEDNGNQHLMYKYSIFTSQFEEQTLNNTRIGSKHMMNMIQSATNNEAYPTDKAEKNNEGIITLYPFGIPKQLHVGATCSQGYAADVEDDNVVVYYSMVGGTQGTNSTLYAADPMDGINNYFLYQNGSVTYTGAGHGLLTGYGRDNNDERRLFINCIVNAGKKSARGSSLALYDLNATTDEVSTGKANKTVIPYSGEDADYYMEIESLDDFDGFDFLASVPGTSKFDHVTVYYDVDHTTTLNHAYGYDSTVDKLIFDSDQHVEKDTSGNIIISNSVDGNILKPICDTTNGIKMRDPSTPMTDLKEDYFDNTHNEYAYIIVKVDTSTGSRTSTKTAVLRIQFKAALNDLN